MARHTSITAAQRRLTNTQIVYEHTKGKTPREIAENVGYSVGHIYKILPRLLDEQALGMRSTLQRELVTQIIQLRWLHSEASAAWERSGGQRTETHERTEGQFIGSEEGEAPELRPGRLKASSSMRQTQGMGDPRYLEQMRATLADIRRILRLDRDDPLREALTEINLTQVNVNAQNPLIPVVLPPTSEIAALMAQFGMNLDGTVKRLPAPEDATEGQGGDVIEGVVTPD